MIRFLLLADALAPGTETTLIGAVTTGVAALVVALLRAFLKEKAEDRLTTISKLAHGAYIITAEVARKTGNTIDDKAAFALGVLDAALAERGRAPLNATERSQAEFAWRAEHSAENLRTLAPGGSAGLAVPR